MVNISNKSNIDLELEITLKVTMLENHTLTVNFSLKSNGDDFELDFDYDFKMDQR